MKSRSNNSDVSAEPRFGILQPSAGEGVSFRVLLLAFSVSLVMLAFEILLTRLFSILLNYHFAFAAVAGATLGSGIGGWFVFRFRQRLNLKRYIAWSGLLLGLSLPFAASIPSWLPPGVSWIVYMLLALPPFVLGGATLCAIFAAWPYSASPIYFVDLTGAAIGTIIPLIALDYLSPGKLVLALSFVALISGLSFSKSTYLEYPERERERKRRLLHGLLGIVVAVSFAVSDEMSFNIDLRAISSDKGIRNVATDESDILYTSWSAQSRIDVVDGPPPTRSIFIDGSSGSRMFPLEGGDLDSLTYMKTDLNYLPFTFGPINDVLIIGAGGGREVLMALIGGAERITAVEVDPGVVKAMAAFSEYNGNIYENQRVRVLVGEGRAAAARSTEKYDLIYLPLVRLESADLKALALVENSVFTREAFADFGRRLSTAGRFAVNVHNDPLALRAYLTWIDALTDLGMSVSDAVRAGAVFVNPALKTNSGFMYPLLILSPERFSEADSTEMLFAALQRGYEPVFVPNVYEDRFADWIDFSATTFGELVSDVPAAILPATDNRPFFYNLAQGPPGAVQNALYLAVGAAALMVIGAMMPKRSGSRWMRAGAITYFSLLGLGFMIIEVTLIQRFTLLFASPTVAITMVIFALLISAGIGSFLAGAFRPALLDKLPLCVLGISAVAYLYRWVLELVAPNLILLASAEQILAVTIGVLPLGLFMGLAFPLGLYYWCVNSDQDISLMWAINGVFSVVGALTAIAMTMIFGFVASLELAAGAYFLAFLVSLRGSSSGSVLDSIRAPGYIEGVSDVTK